MTVKAWIASDGPGYLNRFKKLCEKKNWNINELLLPELGGGGKNFGLWIRPPDSRTSEICYLAHGTGNDHIFPQLHLIHSLVDKGYAVVTCDLDGHGLRSTSTLGNASVDCIAHNLRELAERYSMSRFHIVGQSLGGALALRAATIVPELIASLTVVSTPTYVEVGHVKVLEELITAFRRSFYRQIPYYGPWGVLPALGSFKRSSYPVRINDKRFYVDAVADVFESLKLECLASQLELPVLLVYGTHDPIAPVSMGRDLSDKLAHSELLIVRGETHFTTFFSQIFLEVLHSWIRMRSKEAIPTG